MSDYIVVGSRGLHCYVAGSGNKVLLAFHGYGLDATTFFPLIEHLADSYTIVSVDIPHHGLSDWDTTKFDKELLVLFIQTIIKKYNVTKVSLAGYSLGGRICLTITELLPDAIDKLVLIAPDGLKKNPFYGFATANSIGKILFNTVIKNPTGFIRLADLFHKLKIIDASRHKFVTQYLRTQESRDFLCNVWNTLSEIVPNLENVKKVIRDYKIPVIIFMGRFDRIIPPANANKIKKYSDNVQIHILPKGHRVLDNTNANIIAQSLL